MDCTGLAVLASKARLLYLFSGTKLSDGQWAAIARQATSNSWRVEDLDIACDILNYDYLGIIITRTEVVWIARFSPHLVAAIARAINSCEKDDLRCWEIRLYRGMENKVSVGRDHSGDSKTG